MIMIIVVMGVSGTGKTTVGKALASELEIDFYDADDFHPQCNILKMKQGIPLDDLDRKSWLETLSKNLVQWEATTGAVLACSALKEMYRTALQSGIINDITWLSVTELEKIPIDAYTAPTSTSPRYPVNTAP